LQMKGDPVPTEDHISRYCSPSKCTEEGEVTGTAFQFSMPHEYLSVNWLEYLQQANRQDEIQEVRRVLSSKLTLSSKGKIAVLNVGDIINNVFKNSPDHKILNISHEPEENDPSHSGIYGFKHDDLLISYLIAEVILEAHPAQSP